MFFANSGSIPGDANFIYFLYKSDISLEVYNQYKLIRKNETQHTE